MMSKAAVAHPESPLSSIAIGLKHDAQDLRKPLAMANLEAAAAEEDNEDEAFAALGAPASSSGRFASLLDSAGLQ